MVVLIISVYVSVTFDISAQNAWVLWSMSTISTSGRNEVVIAGAELWVFKFSVESTYEIVSDIEARFNAYFIHVLKLM